jgi:hypothetical protein
LISKTLVDELGLKTYNPVYPCSLAWLQEKFSMRITRGCKVKVVINVDYVNEEESDITPFGACEVMFGSPCSWDRDETLYGKENRYLLVKCG